MLVKGLILFCLLAILILLGVLFVEYLLWLPPTGRLVLFWLGVLALLFLLGRFIIRPLVYLLRLREGISHKQASVLIGKHFPNVGDKLLNLLDLSEDQTKSELLMASIEQRSERLSPVPFTQAVNFNEAWKLTKYLLVPLVVVLFIWISGSFSDFFGSYKRVVNYDMAFQPPAPFEFDVLMGDLRVLETDRYTVQVRTRGRVKPESVSIHVGERELLLQEEGGLYSYTFEPPLQSQEFYFAANGIQSVVFQLVSLKVPSLDDFSMELRYPDYLARPDEEIKSTGNAVFPEGTRVTWKLRGRNTSEIYFETPDTLQKFEDNDGVYTLDKKIFKNVDYKISTSNEYVKQYENLNFQLTVVRDNYPQIKVQEVRDSLNPEEVYFTGEASDDYELVRIGLVVYPEDREEESQKLELIKPGKNFEQFYYTFPSGLSLEPGVNYELYFTATDNDAIHNQKMSRSQVFRLRLLNEEELDSQWLESQEEIIGGIGKTLKEFKQGSETYEDIQQRQREKADLNFKDQEQIRNFLEKQKAQEQLMEKFSRELKENLQERDSESPLDKLLQERLERREMEARKNAELLEELAKIADKIEKEDLAKRLEELGKQRQSNERSLEQILELTKRYYVTEKTAQLARDLKQLAIEQQALAKADLEQKNTEKAQSNLNDNFQQKRKELEELRKDNQSLKKPLSIDVTRQEEQSVEDDQNKALEELQKEQGEDQGSKSSPSDTDKDKARDRQQSAGEKLQEMSKKLEQSGSNMEGGSSIAEDAEMLRQILDNLLTFSFKQEGLFKRMEEEGGDLANYSGQVRDQQELRELFGHVDDSLFALSLRRAEISELVNEQITEVYYNIDKALESIAENRIYQGVSHQQYVFTAANTLADFLASLLDNMQQSLAMGSGEGSSGQGFQLPDIIKSQGELKSKMGNAGKQGEEGKEGSGEGNTGKQGEGTRDGEGSGNKDGQQGKEVGNQGNRDGNGPQQDGGSGHGGPSEEELKEIYEIYKEQQQIREALEQQLNDLIQEKDKELAKKLLRQMEDFENELLENGITERTLSKINRIEHELLKLENAAMKQGKKMERESKSNKRNYINPIITKPGGLENYSKDIEILNRQALPLQKIYQDKVKDYFRADD